MDSLYVVATNDKRAMGLLVMMARLFGVEDLIVVECPHCGLVIAMTDDFRIEQVLAIMSI